MKKNQIENNKEVRYLADKLITTSYHSYRKYFASLRPNAKVLDAGEGDVRYGVLIGAEFSDIHVVILAVDTKTKQVIEARLSALGQNNITVELGTLVQMPFADSTFDFVLRGETVGTIPQYQNAIKEMVRVLKPGGQIILAAMNSWSISRRFFAREGELPHLQHSAQHRLFNPVEAKELLQGRHMQIEAVDGYYLTTLRQWGSNPLVLLELVGVGFDVFVRILGALIKSPIVKVFGFQLFVVARKFEIKVKHSGIFALPSFTDSRGGILLSMEFAKNIPFTAQRVYIISGVARKKAVRGGHAHKSLDQVIFCVNGSFELRLDDGEQYQKIAMRNNGMGVRLGPKLWHSMRRFSPDCVILVLADGYYDEADYIRNYEAFKEYIKKNHDTI